MSDLTNLQRAAQAWCDPRTGHVVMIPELCEVFGEMLDQAETRGIQKAIEKLRSEEAGHANDYWTNWLEKELLEKKDD